MEQWLPSQSEHRGDTVIDGVLMAFELSDLMSETGCAGGMPATSTPAAASAGAGIVHVATASSILSVDGMISRDMGMTLGTEAAVPARKAPANTAARGSGTIDATELMAMNACGDDAARSLRLAMMGENGRTDEQPPATG